MVSENRINQNIGARLSMTLLVVIGKLEFSLTNKQDLPTTVERGVR